MRIIKIYKIKMSYFSYVEAFLLWVMLDNILDFKKKLILLFDFFIISIYKYIYITLYTLFKI